MKKVLKNREKSKMRRKSIFSLFVILMIVDCSLCSLVNLKNSSTSENENLTSQLLTCDDDDGKCKEIHRNHLHFVHKYDEYFLSPQNDDHHEYKNRLKHSSLIYGLLVTASENQLNQKCYKEIMQIYHGIHKKEIWAMKILDASAQFGSGFLLGNNHWLGSRKGCESVNSPFHVTLSDRYERLMKPDLMYDIAPFEVDYRIVYAKHHSPWQIEIKFHMENLLHIGLCLPMSCSNSELHNLTQDYLNYRQLDVQDVYEFQSEVLLVKDLKLRPNFFLKKSVILASILFSIVLCIVFLSWNRDERISESHEAALCQSTYDKILKCFSLHDNYKTLMDDSTSADSINVISGIKSISCFAIFAFHIFWYSFYATSNSGVLFHFTEQFRYQWISNAALMVDAFFTISGFLMTYNFLKNKRQMDEIEGNSWLQNLKLYGKLVVHRYLRLSPLYLIVMLITEIFTSYIVDVSKFWIHERTDLYCQRFWYRNVFYINNLFNHEELCMNWSWSMACEMQFFLVFTFILFIYAKKKSAGIATFLALTFGTYLISIDETVKHKFLPSFDVLWRTGTELYIAPLVRIMPSCVGVACGWYLHSIKRTLNISDRMRSFLYSLAMFLMLMVMHCTYYRDMGVAIASVCILLGRPIIAISTCIFIVLNACGYNCLLSRAFSSKFFIRTNKLTYAIYLLNPIIFGLTFGLLENGSTVDPPLYFVLMIGLGFLTYFLAILFSLLFEIPFYKLSNEILRGSWQSGATQKHQNPKYHESKCQ